MKRYSLLVCCALALDAAAQAPSYDVLIRGGQILDGSGAAPRRADIGIRGERLAAIGHLGNAKAAKVYDASGKVVTPGFIDVHTHVEDGLSDPARRAKLSYVTQGVTSVVAGNCGSGPVDTGRFLATWRQNGIGVNAALLVGHGAVRSAVMGRENGAPTAEELEKMRALVEKAMHEGAYGLSSGLFYEPGHFAKTGEVIELAKIAARHNGIYASHIRDEGNYSVGVVAAVEEAIEIGRQAGLTVEISHLKALGPESWGLGPKLCALIEGARQRGQRVYADQYPYVASGTGLAAAVFPRGAKVADFAQHRAAVERNIERRGGAQSLALVSYRPKPEWAGKTLAEIAAATGRAPVAVVQEVLQNGGAGVVSFNMSEDDVLHIMRHPWVMTASDGSSPVLGAGVPHPRSYGTFARKLQLYAREKKALSLAQAVRAASGLPAEMLRLQDRGLLKKGYYADLLVFDPAKVRERATFTQPHQYSEGMELVLVNGKPAVAEGKPTGGLHGRVLTP
jgi:N-acyl-D-aspartate/D-glutamate deacylase